MIRKATSADADAIDAFLRPHAETSMFLRGNLASHGVGHGDHPHSTDFYLWERGGISALFGITKRGFLLAQAPDAPTEAYAAFAQEISGQTVLGMTGITDQVDAVFEACGLRQASHSLRRKEPLYRLELAVLADPQAEARPVREEDTDLLATWFHHFMIETDTVPGDADVRTAARHRAESAAERNTRLLIEEGAPTAMAALNARVSDMVQVGGVYTPPALRRQGRAGRITAALLTQMRGQGVQTAILFAANLAAARVYESIGFQRCGTYRVALLSQPHTIRAP